jgi:hypothetical protein
MSTGPVLKDISDLQTDATNDSFIIEFDNVLLNYNNLVEEILDKEFNKKPKKSNIYSNAAKANPTTAATQQNLVIQYFKTELEKETANNVFNNLKSALSSSLSSKKKQKNAETSMINFLKSKMTDTEILAKYNAGSGLVVPSAPAVPIVTALATATPVTATGIPIIAPTLATTTTPYEIILDTDKMKFFVYNLFAHDLAHDLFPSGTGLKRVEEIQKDPTTPARTTWFNASHDNTAVAYGGTIVKTNDAYRNMRFQDDEIETNEEQKINEEEIIKYNNFIEEEGLYKKIEKDENDYAGNIDEKYIITSSPDDETNLLQKKKELINLTEEDEKAKTETEKEIIKNNIEEKKNEIEKAKTEIIINKSREFSIDVIKSAGITLEQKGMLWINQHPKRFQDDNVIKRLFLIIDVNTIIEDFIGIPNNDSPRNRRSNLNDADLTNIYLKNPMYPGYIYFDNNIIHPYDITVTRTGPAQTKNENVNFTLTFTTGNNSDDEHKIMFNPYENNFQLTFDGSQYRKLCYYDQNCEISFKDAYNDVVKNKKNAYEFFSSIFNNYINVEISDDMDSYFYFLYPNFLLKRQEEQTKEKFNELFTSINQLQISTKYDIKDVNNNISVDDIKTIESSINTYIEFYKEPFKCFQLKICKYLVKKQTEFLTKYGYKDKDNNPEFLFPKNIQNCTNTDFFLFSLSKMFTQMIVTENKDNTDKNVEKQMFETIYKIVQDSTSKLPKFNNVADDEKPEEMIQDPQYISFLKLVLLNYPTLSKQIKTQSGGGVNDNYSKNAARIISTSVASIMYYLDKVTVPTNNIINTEINICQNIVTKQQASNIDDKLFDDFYTWINETRYAGDLKYYNNNVASSLPVVSFAKKAPKATTSSFSGTATATEPAYTRDTIVGLPTVDFWGWLGIKKPDEYNKNLFFINNAASPPNELSSKRLKKSYLLNWFTKERIKTVDNTDSKKELTQADIDTMIAAVNAGSDQKEKDNVKLKTSYEMFDPLPTAGAPAPDNNFWFCPFSSMIDGQPTCNRFLNRGDIKEKGTLFVTVRNLKRTSVPGGGTDFNEMIYTVKVEPKAGFDNKLVGEHKVLVHVLLKIGGVKIIDYGTIDSKTTVTSDTQLPSDPAIEIDLDSVDSYLDAKECMIRLIDLNIGLLKNHANNPRSWDQLITKLKSDNATTSGTYTSAVKMPFKLHTPGTVSTYTNAEYTSDQLRQKILRTSVIKSLGDYSQELNIVAKNSGYIDTPVTIPRFMNNAKATPVDENPAIKTSISTPQEIRLGFSLDRPSGVRLVLLKLFGKERAGNESRSGTNPKSIVGYYDTLSKAMIAYDKSKFLSPTDSGKYNTDTTIEAKVSDYKGGKKIIRNNTKRRKNVTRKRKKLLKNRKISKRNNKGTRKRK